MTVLTISAEAQSLADLMEISIKVGFRVYLVVWITLVGRIVIYG